MDLNVLTSTTEEKQTVFAKVRTVRVRVYVCACTLCTHAYVWMNQPKMMNADKPNVTVGVFQKPNTIARRIFICMRSKSHAIVLAFCVWCALRLDTRIFSLKQTLKQTHWNRWDFLFQFFDNWNSWFFAWPIEILSNRSPKKTINLHESGASVSQCTWWECRVLCFYRGKFRAENLFESFFKIQSGADHIIFVFESRKKYERKIQIKCCEKNC